MKTIDVDKTKLLEELGRTQTVKDAHAAYNQIFEAQRQLAVRMKHSRQNQQKLQAEIETFLDDLKEITGLPLNSPLFATIASLTIARRLQRRNLERNLIAEDSFPNGW
jgi:ribosomal protein L9